MAFLKSKKTEVQALLGQARAITQTQEEFARGGMGAILRVFDRNIRRNMAMKVMLDRGLPGDSKDSAVNTRAMGRFLDEAQITGQLEHPGIVPVHELGVDESGQASVGGSIVSGVRRGRQLRLA